MRNAKERRVFKLTALIAFISFSIFLRQHSTRADSPTQKTDENPLPAEENLALGLDHFEAHCAVCHGRSGKADTAKGKEVRAADLTSEKVQSRTDTELFQVISNGIPGTAMPGFGKTHKATEIWQSILFLRKLPSLTDEERRKLETAIPPTARHKHRGATEDDHHHEEDHQKMQIARPDGSEGQREQPAERQGPKSSRAQEHRDYMQGSMTDRSSVADMSTMRQEQQPENPAAPLSVGPSSHTTTAIDQMISGIQDQQNASSGLSLTLPDFEQMALKNNPTLIQAEAEIRSAEGRKKQAGLYPNPIVGYSGEEFAFQHFSDKSEHFVFVEQSIVTAGKLGKSRQVFAQEALQTQAEAEVQRMRVLNTVKVLYYEALGIQQIVELRRQLANIASRAVDTSEQLVNVGQADQPDLLVTQNEAAEAELDLAAAVNDQDQAWQVLAAVVGSPDLKPARLEGSLEQNLPALDEATALGELLRASPEMKKAQAGVERARAAVTRARAERIPDLFVRGGIGTSLEPLETLAGTVVGRTGPEAAIEVGVRVPLFNRNQGNIASAQAELSSAESEVKRQQLVLRARLASAFRGYRDALRRVMEYRQNILPRAQRAYELYLAKYQEMAAAYPQVIISQRTLFQARVTYLNSLVAVQQDAARIQGFLLTGGLDAPGSVAKQEATIGGDRQLIKPDTQGTGTRGSRTELER